MPTLHHKLKSRLLALSPRAFELFAGDLLEYIGLRDVAVTRLRGDAGIDAIGTIDTGDALIRIPTGIQVKRHRANVQRPDIDRFIGALSGSFTHGIFITTAGYAPQARIKAESGMPRITTVDGDQVVALMQRKQVGIDTDERIDESYFTQFETYSTTQTLQLAESSEPYSVAGINTTLHPAADLITLRGLSHALRVDPSVLRRAIDRGALIPEQGGSERSGLFFRRDQIEAIRAALLGATPPTDADAWRREFLAFARSRNLSKSYKPVMLKALLTVIDHTGEVPIDRLVAEFRAFYQARRRAGLPIEFGPPDVSDPAAVSDTRLRQIIVQHPLERFLIKGFLQYDAAAGLVRVAPQLWAELRYWELLDVLRSADEQLSYYYGRAPGGA
ncbi:MAG TPA: restriction endonuclease [Roseiflexaceae bacterium]|nr:restriction endonuclease [Roseiflexaceae bacterium]HMP39185.1 restriction endonuclease [Roseiflexaceae bacterium]